MDFSEKLGTITRAYDTFLASGVIKNRGEFASLIDVNRSGLSLAMNGNETYLTDSLVGKVMAKMRELGFCSDPDALPAPSGVLPVIPVEAMAGTLGEFASSVKDYECERMISPIRGADYAMKVCGESMAPEFPNGCQILIKKINEKAFIEWGKVYVLDTENGAVIKQIRRTEKDGVVECVSLNPEFQPFTIETSFIRGWYRVLMVLALK